ncbi:MAG TPA: helix-turn-helix transcriptional regulator [Bryobacteraceae bacterium]|jgi:AraC-like DNA-binding protein
MEFRKRKPAPPLDRFVQFLWSARGEPQPHRFERILPHGDMSLIVNLAEDQTRIYDPADLRRCRVTSGCVVSGAHAEAIVIDTAEQQWVMGAEFKAGAANALLGLSADELAGQHTPLEDHWRGRGRVLRERLLEGRTTGDRLIILERALLDALYPAIELHPAVQYALGEFGRGPHVRTIAEVTARTGFSARRFIQVFRREVGLTPKLFCRVRRFQRAVQLARKGEPVEWTEVALACGYFDQAHFIHDFRAFSGISPGAYAALRGDYPNHVPIGA